jgi:DNA invertase Pin-like site-specific DNA recombinase
MAKKSTIKAVSYLRVSGAGQIDGDGFTRQRASIAKRAKSLGMVIVDEYEDAGVSGTNEMDDRPGLSALLDRIDSNGVRVVLVENASRLARDLMVQEIILQELRKRGVQVIEADGGNDLTVGSNDPTATLIRQVLGAVSQFEKSVLVLKLRAARQRIKKTDGRCEGRKPFGSMPGESLIVEQIKSLRRKPVLGEQRSFKKIADYLNETGVPTRTGSPWSPSTVGQILSR